MDYFNMFTFLGLERVSCIAVYAGSESSDFIKHILICVLKMFGTSWGWVINDRIFVFGWTIPLINLLTKYTYLGLAVFIHSSASAEVGQSLKLLIMI